MNNAFATAVTVTRPSYSTGIRTPRSRVLLEKLTGSKQLVKIFPAFMGPKGLLLHLQEPATCPYPKPDQSSPCTPSHFLKILLILSSHLCLGLTSGLFLHVYPPNLMYTPLLSPIRATCPAHLILLDFITRIMFRKEQSSSLRSFLHSPVTSSLLGPNNLLSTLFSKTLSLRSSFNVSNQVSHPYKTGNIIACSTGTWPVNTCVLQNNHLVLRTVLQMILYGQPVRLSRKTKQQAKRLQDNNQMWKYVLDRSRAKCRHRLFQTPMLFSALRRKRRA